MFVFRNVFEIWCLLFGIEDLLQQAAVPPWRNSTIRTSDLIFDSLADMIDSCQEKKGILLPVSERKYLILCFPEHW